MRLLDRHILAELVPTFLLSVTLFAGFIWIAAGPLLKAISYLSDGLPLGIVLEIAGLYLPPMLVLAFPMGMLIAAILGFTRLSSDSEAVALFASGVSFYRMLVPVTLFGAAVAVIGLVFNNSIAPAASKRIDYFASASAVVKNLKESSNPIELPPLRDNSKAKKILATIHIEGGFDSRQRALRGVTIVQFDTATGQPQSLTYAKYAQWNGGANWIASDGYSMAGGVVARLPKQFRLTAITETPDTVALEGRNLDVYSFSELSRYVNELKKEGYNDNQQLREAQVELWEKIALPCASFVFALVGAPLALKPQRAASRGVAFGWGIGLILGYYALSKYLSILAQSGGIDPALAAFLPNLLGLGLAGYLIFRATT